jgi:hypothetical protein
MQRTKGKTMPTYPVTHESICKECGERISLAANIWFHDHSGTRWCDDSRKKWWQKLFGSWDVKFASPVDELTFKI